MDGVTGKGADGAVGYSTPFKRYIIFVVIFWTIILSGSFFWALTLVTNHAAQINLVRADVIHQLNQSQEFSPPSDQNRSDKIPDAALRHDVAPHLELVKISKMSATTVIIVTHIVIWLLGLCGLAAGVRQIHKTRQARNRAEAALRDSEIRFRDIAEVSGDWIWEMDCDLCFSYFSDRFYTLTGRLPGTCIGDTRDALAGHPVLTEKWRAHLADLENRRAFRDFEYSATCADGKQHYFSISGKPVFDDAGVFSGYRGVGSDITEQKQAEREICEKSAHLQTILDLAPFSISLWDTDRRFVFVNKRLATNLGGVPEDYIGENVSEMFGDVSGQTVEGLVVEALERKKAILDRDFPHPRRAGRFDRYNVIPVLDADGEVSGALAIGQDVTVYENAMLDLRAKEKELRSLLDNSPEAISLKGTDGRFRFVNKRFLEWYDMTEGSIIGRTLAECFSNLKCESDAAEVSIAAHDREVFDSKRATVREDITPFPDGKSYTLSTKRFPILNDKGEITGLGSINTDISEQKRADREASEKALLLSSILNAAPLFFSFRDPEGRFEFVNKKMADEWGGRPEDYIGQTAAEVLGEYPTPSVREVFKEALQKQVPILDREIRPAIRPGKIYRYSFVPLFDEINRFSGILTIGQDVTELKKSEESVRENEALLNSIVENSPVTISLKGLDGRFQLANKAFMKIFNVEPSQITGLSDHVFLEAAHVTAKVAQERKVLSTGKAVTEEREGILPNGDSFRHLMTKFPVRNQEGVIVGLGTIGADLTALREVERNLHAMEARFSEILRIAPEAIISVDEQGKILVFNEAAGRVFGYEGEDVLGQSITMLLPPDIREKHSGFIEAFTHGGNPFQHMSSRGEIRGCRRDGTLFPAEASISKLRLEGCMIFTVTMHDITKRKQADAALRRALDEARNANLAKQDFMAKMSHELRTPLNAILGFSDVIIMELFGGVGNERYKGYIHDISTSAGHLLALVKDLLDLSKIEAGAVELERKQFELVDVIAAAVRELRGDMEEKELTYTGPAGNQEAIVLADIDAVRKIVTNLLTNAIKFTPEGGRIGLSLAPNGAEFVDMTIWDTGIGIAPEDQDDALKPFTQVGDIRIANKGGVGLGLSIVKALTEIQGGRVKIESAKGSGTRVFVSLPKAPSIVLQ